ncbi:MAG: glycosyltransferase, partial [Gammaproteobacteria bacterium]|nr:glycosyltransferase [Gammaproteobacteria bacterium]
QNLFYLNYDSRLSARDISVKHIKRAQLFPTLFRPLFPTDSISAELSNIKSTNRKRRIAYVSSDFRFHSVAFFFLPVLQNHDSDNFEVYCYSSSNKADDITDEFKKYSQHWRDIVDLNDEEVIQLAINDKIDILVDLSGYSAGSRLGVFANRVAPLQISYLGYPNTTGLTTVDYRVTDYYTDPVGLTEHLNTEKLARLDDVFLCFSPQSSCPTVSESPFEKNGFITFGSFNNMAKINDDVIKIWSELLLNFSNSKLLLKSKALADPDVQQFILSRFKNYGISNDRILLKNYANDFVSHVCAYSDMDIALDTFPYNGTTTTCEALWMGVPVITLLGNSHISRVSASILHKLELDDFITHSNEDYINIACKLATDKHVLPNLRSTMRERIQNSGFINGVEFTKNLENLYQKIWQERMSTLEMTCAY